MPRLHKWEGLETLRTEVRSFRQIPKTLLREGHSFGALRKVAVLIEDSVAQNFEDEGGNEPWEPLAVSTKKGRKDEGFEASHPILQKTGALAASFKVQVTRVSYNVFDVVVKFLEYGLYHQSDAKRSRLPARRFLDLKPAEAERIIEILESDSEKQSKAKNKK